MADDTCFQDRQGCNRAVENCLSILFTPCYIRSCLLENFPLSVLLHWLFWVIWLLEAGTKFVEFASWSVYEATMKLSQLRLLLAGFQAARCGHPTVLTSAMPPEFQAHQVNKPHKPLGSTWESPVDFAWSFSTDLSTWPWHYSRYHRMYYISDCTHFPLTQRRKSWPILSSVTSLVNELRLI